MTTQTDKQSVYTLPETVTTISLYEYGGEWWVKRVVTANDKNYSKCSEFIILCAGSCSYQYALHIYNQACASQSFLPDNKTSESNRPVIIYDIEKDEVYYNSSESGQGIILFLLALVAIVVCLYFAYTGISLLSGSTNILGTMLDGLSEVLK